MLREDPALAGTSQNVDVKVSKGVVTLSGTVPSEAAKELLVNKVRAVPGVDRVTDKVGVKAES